MLSGQLISSTGCLQDCLDNCQHAIPVLSGSRGWIDLSTLHLFTITFLDPPLIYEGSL
jgi:hypothetical protein